MTTIIPSPRKPGRRPRNGTAATSFCVRLTPDERRALDTAARKGWERQRALNGANGGAS